MGGRIFAAHSQGMCFRPGSQSRPPHPAGRFQGHADQDCQRADVRLILLGGPAGEKSALDLETLEAFGALIEAKTGVETRIG